jgi:hypothetical protein
MNRKYRGLPKRGGGLKHIQHYNDSGDDGNEDDDSEDSEEESDSEVAHRQLEARSWLSESGKKAQNWFLSTLSDDTEATVRSNDEPQVMMDLIKSSIKLG